MLQAIISCCMPVRNYAEPVTTHAAGFHFTRQQGNVVEQKDR